MHAEPAKSPRARRLRGPVLGAGLVLAIVAAAVAALACRPPAFYAARLAAAADAEQGARRLVTKAAAVEAALGRPGRWEAAVTEAEINGFLAADLPRNHAAVLPGWLEAPRVVLEPHAVTVAARLRAGPLEPVIHAAIELRLVAAGQIQCRLLRAGLGGVPLPRGPFLHRLAAALRRRDAVVELRRIDGESRLVVTLPRGRDGATRRLEALAIGPGELLLAGTTEAAR